MPSKSETFGLVMLEAMATGTPVAAYPVDGPLEVLGSEDKLVHGGGLDDDLSNSWHRALIVPRKEARARSECFSWSHSSSLFLEYLVPAHQSAFRP
jgi:glycosyltransferase involved in cell wall biosynthesis